MNKLTKFYIWCINICLLTYLHIRILKINKYKVLLIDNVMINMLSNNVTEKHNRTNTISWL